MAQKLGSVGSDYYFGFLDGTIKADIERVRQGMTAAEKTLMRPPIGKVVVSRRKKLRGEKRKPAHGKAIANFLRDKGGRDPFATSGPVIRRISDMFVDDIQIALHTAYTTRKQRKAMVRRAVIDAAQLLAEWASKNIKAGGLGQKKIPEPSAKETDPKLKLRKRRKQQTFYRYLRFLIKIGRATDKYGFPPPYGIMSTRFVEGIRALPRK